MEQDKKIIFGLSPVATLVNSFLLITLNQLIWAIKYIKIIPAGTKDLNTINVEVPWYYDFPLDMLVIFMVWKWVESKYDIKPGELTWKSVKFKYIYTIFFIWALSQLVRFNFLILLGK